MSGGPENVVIGGYYCLAVLQTGGSFAGGSQYSGTFSAGSGVRIVGSTADYGGKRTSGKFPNTPKKTATLAHHFSGGAPGRETRASQGDFVAILLCVWQSCMMKRVTGAQFYKRELSLIVSMIVFFRFVFGVLSEGQGVYVSSK